MPPLLILAADQAKARAVAQFLGLRSAPIGWIPLNDPDQLRGTHGAHVLIDGSATFHPRRAEFFEALTVSQAFVSKIEDFRL